MKQIITLLILGILCSVVASDMSIRPARIFSDNMVLQHGVPIPVWGWSSVGQTITVTLAGQQVQGEVKANEKWFLELPPVEISRKPLVMTIRGSAEKEQIVLKNVLIGEVWLCAGQSNMEMISGFEDAKNYRGILNYPKEIADSNFPMVRFLNVPKSMTGFPAPDAAMQWELCNSRSAEFFSAIGFIFGREFFRRKNVPVGMINISLGGSEAIRFMPEELVLKNDAVSHAIKEKIYQKNKKFAENAAKKNFTVAEIQKRWELDVIHDCATTPAQVPSLEWMKRNYKIRSRESTPQIVSSGVFNGMFSPVIPYAINGILWYQGESDLALGEDYSKMIVPLVNFWRKIWNNPKLPVYAAELAPFDYTKSSWPMKNAPSDQREKLNRGIRSIKNLNDADTVNTDDLTGDMNDIHPRDKKSIALRFVNFAIKNSK